MTTTNQIRSEFPLGNLDVQFVCPQCRMRQTIRINLMGYADEPINVAYRFSKNCRFGHKMYRVYDPGIVDYLLELNSLGYEVEFDPVKGFGSEDPFLELKSSKANINLAALLESAIVHWQILEPDIGHCSVRYGAEGLDQTMSIHDAQIQFDGYRSNMSNIAFHSDGLDRNAILTLLSILSEVAPRWKDKRGEDMNEEFEEAKEKFFEELEKKLKEEGAG